MGTEATHQQQNNFRFIIPLLLLVVPLEVVASSTQSTSSAPIRVATAQNPKHMPLHSLTRTGRTAMPAIAGRHGGFAMKSLATRSSLLSYPPSAFVFGREQIRGGGDAKPYSSSLMTSTKAARTALDETSIKGEFKRKESEWRNWISQEPESPFLPEAGRYHLYVAYACPWAHRTLMVRALKGLEDVISITVVHPIWQYTKPDVDEHRGWIFAKSGAESSLTNTKGLGGPFPLAYPGNEPDPLLGAQTVRDVYEAAGDVNGKYSVPILWDKKTNTIVNNESSEIIRMLHREFQDFATRNKDLDLYPPELQDAIEAVNEWIYPTINNGVYRCGFAQSQEAYDTAIDELTASFDRLDQLLQRQRFLVSDTQITEADIRLLVTLLRFDEVYTVYFKTNTRSVATTPSILRYCRDVLQTHPELIPTIDMEQIKTHYYCSHVELNTYSIVPRGSNFLKLLLENNKE